MFNESGESIKNEKGAVIVEYSIALALLIPLLMGTWEVGKTLIAYQELSSIAKEVTKIGVRDFRIGEGLCETEGATSTGPGCASQYAIHDRGVKLIDQSKWAKEAIKTGEDFKITTNLVKIGTRRELSVKISAPFSALYMFGRDIDLAVAESAYHIGKS